MNEVGALAWRERATFAVDADGFGGIARRHPQGLLERQPQRLVHIGDGVDHGEVGAGQRAVGEA